MFSYYSLKACSLVNWERIGSEENKEAKNKYATYIKHPIYRKTQIWHGSGNQ